MEAKFKINTAKTMGVTGFDFDGKIIRIENLTEEHLNRLGKEKSPYVEAIEEKPVTEKK